MAAEETAMNNHNGRTPLSEIHNSDRVRITGMAGREKRLVVSFTGVGKLDTRQQSEEFVRYGHQGGRNHVLFVADTLRSWYNDPGIFEEICDMVEAYRREHGIEETVTFGNSMGGYGAVLFAGALSATRCLSISAQYSADPAVVPEENRWREYRDKIRKFTRPPLEDVLSPDCQYFVLHGGGHREQPHWSRWPRAPFMHHYLVGRAGHRVGRKMKESGLVEKATRFAIAGRPRAFRQSLAPLGLRRPPQAERT